MLTEENIKKFQGIEKVHISISIDGFDKKTYEDIRVNGNFDLLKENLQILKHYKNKFKNLTYALMMVPQKRNYDSIIKAFDFAVENDFCDIRFLNLNDNRKSIILNNEELNIVKRQIYECIESKYKNNYNISINTNIDLEKEKLIEYNPNFNYKETDILNYFDNNSNICKAPFTNILIHRFRKVSLDCLCNFSIGKTINTLDEAWNSKYMQKIRKGLLENDPISSCKNCYKYNIVNENKNKGI